MDKNQQTLDKLVFDEIENEDIIDVPKDIMDDLTKVYCNGLEDKDKDSGFNIDSPNYSKFNGFAIRLFRNNTTDDSLRKKLNQILLKK